MVLVVHLRRYNCAMFGIERAAAHSLAGIVSARRKQYGQENDSALFRLVPNLPLV